MSGATPSIWQVTSSKSWGGRESLPVDLHLEFTARGITSRLFCAEGSAIAARYGRQPGVTALPFSGKFDSRTLRSMRANLAADSPEVVISHYSHDLFILRRLLPSRNGARLVLVKHVGPGKSKKDIIHRWVYRRVDLVLGVSEYLACRCREAYPIPGDRVTIWHPGVAAGRLAHQPDARHRIRRQYGIKDNDILIGYLARLTPGKGHEELLTAFFSLAAARDDVFLGLPGSASPDEQDFADELESRVHTSPAGTRVILPGFVEKVFDWLNACDIFVNPAPREAFGLNTVEAMAAGLPIVGTSGGGTPEIITDGQNGLLVEPDNPQQLSSALTRLIDRAALRRQLGQAARETFSARFTMQRSADHLLKLVF